MAENSLFNTNIFFLLKRTHKFRSTKHPIERMFFDSWHIKNIFFYRFIKIKQNMCFTNNKVGMPTNYFDDCLGAYVFDCAQGLMVPNIMNWCSWIKKSIMMRILMHVHHEDPKFLQQGHPKHKINNLEIIDLFIVSFSQIDICMIYTTLQLA